MKFKRILSFVASAAMTISALCGAMSITASADYSGSCGTYVRYTIYTSATDEYEANTLVVYVNPIFEDSTAEKIMPDYTGYSNTPWYSRRTNINHIVVKDGVSAIGKYAFSNLTSATDVVIADSVTKIGDYAFQNSSALTELKQSTLVKAQQEGEEDTETVAVGFPTKLVSIGEYAFSNCSALEGITSIPDTVTTIGNYAFDGAAKMFTTLTLNRTGALESIGNSAFRGCNSLTSLALNNNRHITEIPSYMCSNCKGLTSVRLPSTCKTINDYAFNGCSELNSVSMSSVQTIGGNAFKGCTALATISMPSSVTSLGNYAFSESGLTSVTIPSTLTNFGIYVFRDCKALTTATIPSTITAIPDDTFEGCTALTGVTFQGKNVTSIGKYAFTNCDSLVSFNIPEGVTSIGNNAFQNCDKLASVNFPYSVKSIGNSAFANCPLLTSVPMPSTLETMGTNIFANCVALENVMIPSSVKEVPANAFDGCIKLSSVAFPDTVEAIGANAFKGCVALKSITLPKNLTSVTGQAFAGCTALTEIKAHPESTAFSNSTNNVSYTGVLLNKDQTEIVAYPMGGPTSVNLLQISPLLTKVGDYAFYQNTKVYSITIPATLTEIGNYAFAECTAISSVTIPGEVVSIGKYAFQKDTSLRTLTLTSANKLETIGDYAFDGCSVLTGFTLPSTADKNMLKSIGARAFKDCVNLTTANFQTTSVLETLGDAAFQGCTILTSITIPDTVTSLGAFAFQDCSTLANVKLSKNITSIGNGTFTSCAALTTVSIPAKVTTIGNNAFNKSGLEEIIIPNSVTTMGTGDFQDCKALKKAVISKNVTTIPNTAFSGANNEDLEIYLLGTIKTITTSGSFGNNANTYVKGTIYVFDETSYTTLSKATCITNKNNATLKYGTDMTDLKAIIEEAKSLSPVDYTASSYSKLENALTLAEFITSDFSANQAQADSAVAALRSAIDSLVLLDDNSEALGKLQALIADVEATYVKSDYTTVTWSKLSSALKDGKTADSRTLNSIVYKYMDDINAAVENLHVVYAFDNGNIAYIYSQNKVAVTQIRSGNATEAMAGATKIKFTFDCASDVSYNNNATIELKAVIKGTESYYKFYGDKGYTTGVKGCVATLDLTNPVAAGDSYEISGFTYSWGGAADYVYAITNVDFLDDEGNVLASIEEIIPTADLIAAVEEAEGTDTSSWTAERKQALQDAIDNAKEILDQEYPLPSVVDAAEKAIKDAIAGTSGSSADYSALDEAIKGVPADLSKYTDESVKALNDALAAVDRNLDASKQDQVDAYVTAIKNAITNLKLKSAQPGASNNNNNNTTTVAPSKTTRSPAAVKKDKLAAKKVMKQAKITKLTAKGKAKKKVTVSWKKVKGAKGYQVQVSAKKNFKKVLYKKFVKKNKLTVKSSKIKSKKTYYVRVRAYATYKDKNGKAQKVYSKWNKKLRKVKAK